MAPERFGTATLYEAILLDDGVSNLDGFKKERNAETWPKRFIHAINHDSVKFYVFNDSMTEPPPLYASVIVTK